MRSVPLSFVCADPDGLSWLDDLSAGLARLSGFDQPPLEFIKFVRRFVSTTAAVDLETLPAGGAGEYRISFKPSQAFLALMSAVWACQPHDNAITEIAHSRSSVGSVTRPIVGDDGEGVTPLLSLSFSVPSPIGVSSLVSVADGTCPGGSDTKSARAFLMSSTPADDGSFVAPRGRSVTAQS